MIDKARNWPIKDQLKYYVAREVYRKRRDTAPNPIKDADGRSRVVTWEEWFEWKYKQNLDAYIAECQSRA